MLNKRATANSYVMKFESSTGMVHIEQKLITSVLAHDPIDFTTHYNDIKWEVEGLVAGSGSHVIKLPLARFYWTSDVAKSASA